MVLTKSEFLSIFFWAHAVLSGFVLATFLKFFIFFTLQNLHYSYEFLLVLNLFPVDFFGLVAGLSV